MKQQTRYTSRTLNAVLASQGRKASWLAAQVGVSKSGFSLMANGKRTFPEDVARRVAELLQVPFFVLFEIPSGTKSVPMRDDEPAGEEAA